VAAAEIKRLEESLALLSAADDAEIVASLNAKILAAKARVVSAKPLAQQVEGLVSYIARKNAKMLSLKTVIVEAHQDLLLIGEDVRSKEAQLAELRVQLASEAQPNLVAQASLASSQQQQLSALQNTVQVLCNALSQSSIPIPEEVRTSIAIASAPSAPQGAIGTPNLFADVDFANNGQASFGAALPSLGVRAAAQPYPEAPRQVFGGDHSLVDATMGGSELPVGAPGVVDVSDSAVTNALTAAADASPLGGTATPPGAA